MKDSGQSPPPHCFTKVFQFFLFFSVRQKRSCPQDGGEFGEGGNCDSLDDSDSAAKRRKIAVTGATEAGINKRTAAVSAETSSCRPLPCFTQDVKGQVAC